MTDLPFGEFVDSFNVTFYTLILNNTASRNVSALQESGLKDIASFLKPVLEISPRVTGSFRSDLTNRDDLLLSFISLLLLLVIESIVTTILLRSNHPEHISTFGFSIKQIIQLVREFKIFAIFPPLNKSLDTPRPRHRYNKRLLALAFIVIFSTVALEVTVLFLTDPFGKNVNNNIATFRLMQPVTPQWDKVHFHSRVSINRPCEAMVLEQVDQGPTKLHGCVNTNINFNTIDPLYPATPETIDYTIISNLHDYGSDHEVYVGNVSATYSMRVFFKLGDGKLRIMKSNETSSKEPEQMEIVHVQFLAYVFSLYRLAYREIDPAMNLERLRGLKFSFTKMDDVERIDVLQLPGNKELVSQRRYVTKVSGILPQGTRVLRLAQQHFRGLAAVVVADPDENDLFAEQGPKKARAVVWKEMVRTVNWLSMVIVLLAGLFVLIVMRLYFKSVSTAEIAGVFVKKAVGADLYRSPLELEPHEKPYFRVWLESNESSYSYGAEIAGQRQRPSNEY